LEAVQKENSRSFILRGEIIWVLTVSQSATNSATNQLYMAVFFGGASHTI
jgi:hypothetical protein